MPPETVEGLQLEPALRAWGGVLGDEHVKAAEEVLARYARTTDVRPIHPAAVLCPASATEVAEVLKIASMYRVPVYPISKGKNWGYGDACAPHDGQVILDLGRMNRIVELNEKLCYVVVEPGVTQGQLYNYLRERKAKLWMDSAGAGLEASLIGNTLERGFGHTRYGDHALSACGLEVVLSDGRILRTGFGHYANARARHTYRYGVGPFLDGIFTQSNFGVVTQMGLWLMPEPEAFSAFFLSTADPDDLPDLVDRLARLRLQGLLQSTVHIGNDLRVLSGRMSYPWERAAGQTPLPAELRAQLRREFAVGAWNACGATYGARESVAAVNRVLKRELRKYRPRFINDRTMHRAGQVQRLLSRVGLGKRLAEQIKWVTPVYGLLKGIPTNEPLRGAGWRVRDAAAATSATDPLDRHVGLMWVAPVLPATGEAARELLSAIEPIYHKYGFEQFVTITLINERSACCVTNIAFDRRNALESRSAQLCYSELTGAVMSRGFLPYRTSPGAVPILAEGSSVFWDVAAEIKWALDPAGVISPGRYHPSSVAATLKMCQNQGRRVA